MTELFVPFMAAGAEFRRFLFEHRGPVAAVELVTVVTDIIIGMPVKHFLAAGEFILMTVAAALARQTGRQIGPVGGVRVVAVETEIPAAVGAEMVMGFEKAADYLRVAVEAVGLGRSLICLMAATAFPFGKGLMAELPGHFRFLAAVGMMTAQAVTVFQITAKMAAAQAGSGRMTLKTDTGSRALENAGLVAAVRIVTGVTVVFGKGAMSVFIFLFGFVFVAGKTFTARLLFQQVTEFGGMGLVALTALAAFGRFMGSGRAVDNFYQLFVAGGAEFAAA